MTHDVIVIGGGPAGSAAALLLARAGRSVCLLERKHTAHHKVCGEFISWEAAHYLSAFGIDPAQHGAAAITALSLYDGAAVLESSLPFTAWSLSRRRMDELLLEQAERAGVDVRRGIAVRELLREPSGWRIMPATGNAQCARVVFLASGKHDLRDKKRDTAPLANAADTLGLKMHLRLQDDARDSLAGRVEVFLYDGGYAGLELIEGGMANLCLLVPGAVYRACEADWSRLMEWLAAQSAPLGERLRDSQPAWEQPLGVYGTPYGFLYQDRGEAPDVFRLGDQMAVIPSFAGDGISIALHSGVLAARTFLAGGDSATYHQEALRHFSGPVRNAALLDALLRRTWGRRLAFMAGRNRALLHACVRGIRIREVQLQIPPVQPAGSRRRDPSVRQ